MTLANSSDWAEVERRAKRFEGCGNSECSVAWFTVHLIDPVGPIGIKNSAGQTIAFDGMTTEKKAMELCHSLKPKCKTVQLFNGKNLGKFVCQL